MINQIGPRSMSLEANESLQEAFLNWPKGEKTTPTPASVENVETTKCRNNAALNSLIIFQTNFDFQR